VATSRRISDQQHGSSIRPTAGLIVLTVLFAIVLVRPALAYVVEPGSSNNEVRIQIDDRRGATDSAVLSAEIVSAPAWMTATSPEITTGRVRTIVVTFDVAEAAMGPGGVLIVHLIGESPSGLPTIDRLRSIPLTLAGNADPVQRGFTIDECCLTPSTVEEPDVTLALPILVGVTPNPVRNLANVVFALPEEGGHADLRIYDVQGRTMERIETPHLAGGYHKIAWDGTDLRGRDVAPGVYFYTLSVGSWTETRKLQLLK